MAGEQMNHAGFSGGSLSTFQNSGSVSGRAETAVRRGVSQGLISGTAESTPNPAGSAGPSRVAAFLMGLCRFSALLIVPGNSSPGRQANSGQCSCSAAGKADRTPFL